MTRGRAAQLDGIAPASVQLEIADGVTLASIEREGHAARRAVECARGERLAERQVAGPVRERDGGDRSREHQRAGLVVEGRSRERAAECHVRGLGPEIGRHGHVPPECDRSAQVDDAGGGHRIGEHDPRAAVVDRQLIERIAGGHDGT